MAATTQRGSSNRSSSRGRTSSNGSSGSSGSRSGASAKSNSGSSRASRSGSGSSRSANAKSKASKASKAKETASSAAKSATGNGGTNDKSSARDTITQVAIPAVTGAIGVAGGVLLGRTALQKNRKILGIPVPGVKVDMSDLSKQIGEAGRQFGKLAREVKVAREKAEKIGRAVT
jgi:hypothetical protein